MLTSLNNSAYSESLIVHIRRADNLRKESIDFPSLKLNLRQLCDLELLLNRACYPLAGYLCRKEYESVLDTMRLCDSTLWPMPICLDVSEKVAEGIEPGMPVAIRDPEGFMLAVLHVEECFRPDKRREAQALFGTDNPDLHPGVQHLFEQTGPVLIGGRLEGLHLPQHYDFTDLRLAPWEAHRIFNKKGWRNIIAFQSENVLHRAEREMLFAAAREAGASLFLQLIIEQPKLGDVDHFVLVRCFQEFVKTFPKNMVELGILPMATLKAGPREALWRAILQKNYGVSHICIAEDQCDPYSGMDTNDRFYPKGEALRLVEEYEEEIDISTIPLRPMGYIEEKAQYVVLDDIADPTTVKSLSPAEFKRRLDTDLEIPEWYSYPEIINELRLNFPPRSRQGFTLFITGLSGAGKSTLAKVLFIKLSEMRGRPVTLLDGDIVRENLSSELSFSKEHRNLNVKRIGFVASEITKNRGIAICAPIAPYEESRRAARDRVEKYGGFIEIFLSTPLEICERRDRKGIYAKARAGIMKGVTGIDDPYEKPTSADLNIDTSNISPAEAAHDALLFLREQGYIF
ncbi:bifunctional sulfate adenylyltransferase/adenylylsulfate kinase [Desulfovibrio inopinatus]|uniref:bifunctional sulfate adenylyltransferase/adenylylsulfate kinase n=1 Tax=Desulfovibrio inopinatus TaxID=102109 RepID=UPI000411A5FC|nr:bifunctional sulfate adenylyltransferase/adenylylsulfate kinase [Desulfovibrio inopinatus]